MITGAPLNNQFLELLSEPAFASVAALVGMNKDPRKVEVSLDLNVFNCTAIGQGSVLLFGKETAGWNWGFDDAQPTTLACVARFSSIRNAVTKTSTTSFTYGQRVLLYGSDDGASVKGRANGEDPVASSTWTTAQGTKVLSTDSNPLVLGLDSTIYTHLRLYELWVRVNDIVVCHIRPKVSHQGAAGATSVTIPDLSGYGNDLVVSGTQGTNFLFGEAYTRETPFTGSEVLA